MKDKMNRREFLEQLAGWSGIILAANLPEKALAEVTRQTGNVQSLNIQSITIPIGLPQPFKVLHISDTHLVRVDGRDDELKRKLAALRYDKYRWAEHCLNAAIEYAKKQGINSIYLEGNTRLKASIALYRSLGFVEIPLQGNAYERCDILMCWRTSKGS